MATDGTKVALAGSQTSTWSNGPVKFQVEGWLVGKIRKDKATLVALLSNNVLELSVDLSSGERVSLREFALSSETDNKKLKTSTKVERTQATKGVKRTSSRDEVPPSIATGTLDLVSPPGPPKTVPPKAKKSTPLAGKGTPVRDFLVGSFGVSIKGVKSVEKKESGWIEVRGRKASRSPNRDLPKSADPERGAAGAVTSESLAKFAAISARLKRIGYEPKKDNDLDSVLAELRIKEPILADKIVGTSKVWRDYALSISIAGYEESSILRTNAKSPPPPPQGVGGEGVRRSTQKEDDKSEVKENPEETDSKTQG